MKWYIEDNETTITSTNEAIFNFLFRVFLKKEFMIVETHFDGFAKQKLKKERN